MPYLLVIALSLVVDQLVKFYVSTHLEVFESAPLVPGVIELLHIRNTGGGFSVLEGHTWLLMVITALLMMGIAWLLVQKRFPHPLAMWSLTVILGGGLGNLLDRFRLGYVVDMFNFQFVNYPVFNVADVLVVAGTIGFAAYYVLLHDKAGKKKEAEEHGAGPSESGS